MKLLAFAIALSSLSGLQCSPSTPTRHPRVVAPSQVTERSQVDPPVECGSAEACAPPTSSTVPQPPIVDLTGAEGQHCLAQGGSVEECSVPSTTVPQPPTPPAEDSAEGGAPNTAPAGIPYVNEE